MNFKINIGQKNPGENESIICVHFNTKFKMVRLIYGVRIRNDSYICHGKVTGKGHKGASWVQITCV